MEQPPVTTDGRAIMAKRVSKIDRHVGLRIRERRRALGISQEALSKPLRFTYQQLQKIEQGANRVSPSRLYQLSGLLNVPLDFFFEGAPTKPDAMVAS